MIKNTIMKRNGLIIILGLLFCSVMLTSCSKEAEDGIWDAIQITVNGKNCKKSSYKVPSEGGEFKIYSKNYGSLWLNRIKENGNTVWPENYDWTDYENIDLQKEWYEVKYDNSGNIVVNIQPKDNSDASRSLTFSLENGDAFGSITLLQE